MSILRAMFFVVSKIFWALAQPLMFFTLLFIIAVLFRRYLWARKLLMVTACLFIVAGVVPIGPLIIRHLEAEADIPKNLPSRIDGIIVLGGAVNAESSNIRHQPQLNEWSERVFEMMRLSRTYPQARVIYSGGAASLHGQGNQEAEIVRQMLNGLNFPIDNFIFETQSRNTFENITYSKALINPQPGENWLLITSAFHIPRAKAVFEKLGWNVIPYPAGFIENGSIKLWQFVDVSGNYWKLNIAAKEIIGIIAYRLSGRI